MVILDCDSRQFMPSCGAAQGNIDRSINHQVAARVMAFDGTAKKFTPLTKSFLPFVNNGTNTINTLGMSVTMTTKQIGVAAEGQINLQNKPDLGADSPKEVNFYTVVSHPSPQNDPTTPVGGAAGVTLSYQASGGKLILSWSGTGDTLESKASLTDFSLWSRRRSKGIAGGLSFR
jgi:hypothetical protein